MDIKRLIAKTKWRTATGYNWISFLGISLVIVQAVQKYIEVPIYIIYPVTMVGLYILGTILDKYGLVSKELEYASERNTYFQKYMKGNKK